MSALHGYTENIIKHYKAMLETNDIAAMLKKQHLVYTIRLL
jgi:hypothetical protein